MLINRNHMILNTSLFHECIFYISIVSIVTQRQESIYVFIRILWYHKCPRMNVCEGMRHGPAIGQGINFLNSKMCVRW